jgi:hypothetical protein
MADKPSKQADEPVVDEPLRGPYAEWRGPYEEMATPPEPGQPALTIAAPVEGATVPPVHDVTGTGATPGASLTLAYGAGETVVATVNAEADGSWGFVGDQASAIGPQTWTVRDGERTASVSITVEEPVSRKTRKDDDDDEGEGKPKRRG